MNDAQRDYLAEVQKKWAGRPLVNGLIGDTHLWELEVVRAEYDRLGGTE